MVVGAVPQARVEVELAVEAALGDLERLLALVPAAPGPHLDVDQLQQLFHVVEVGIFHEHEHYGPDEPRAFGFVSVRHVT